jgi:calcium-dependent protein kinase
MTDRIHKKHSLQISNFVRHRKSNYIEDYQIVKKIGKGGFGQVYLMKDKITGMFYCGKAIKKDSLSSFESEDIFSEIRTLAQIDHPNIVKIICYYIASDHIMIVSEYISGGELFDRIVQNKVFNEYDAARYIEEILYAVSYLHKMKIVHRDIKPENILFESKDENARVKLIDFGNSRKIDLNEKLKNPLGSLFYIAPEVLDRDYDHKCDIWSCGVVLYIMIFGVPPFTGETEEEIFSKIRKGVVCFPKTEYTVSNESKAIISLMLNINPKSRPTADALLKHVWFDRIRQKQIKPNLEGAVIVKLQKFHTKNQFQKAVIMYLVTTFDLKGQKEQLLEIFRSMDIDNDGHINKDELLTVYHKFTKDERIPTVIEHIMHELDINDNNCLDFSEFLMATLNYQLVLNDQILKQIFDSIDIKGNQSLRMEDIGAFLNLTGPEHAAELSTLVKEADKDGNGVITFNEFMELMKDFVKHSVDLASKKAI